MKMRPRRARCRVQGAGGMIIRRFGVATDAHGHAEAFFEEILQVIRIRITAGEGDRFGRGR